MSEEPLSSRSDKGHWDKLAESLGIKPSVETGDSLGGGVLKQPEHSETKEETPSGEASPSSAVEDQTKVEGSASAPSGIPLRRGWASESRPASNWDEIARQLGIVPSHPSATATSDSLEPVPASALTKGASGVAPAPAALERISPQTAASDPGPVLSPVEQTIEPPVFEDATSVAVAGPEETATIVQEEVAPSGDWLEEQVVAPVEASGASGDTWPITQDILDIKDSKQAIAADTLFLPEVTSVVPSDKQEDEAESRAAEKKGRKRHRRKKKSRGTTPVNPEPFEEELPEIVELASAEEDNGALPAPHGSNEGSGTRRQEVVDASDGARKKGHRTTSETAHVTDDVEELPEGGEDSDVVRPAHKAIPGWSEVVGYVIQKNMESRSRRPNHRDRRR